MTEEGTLSIVRQGNTYQVRYASNNPRGRDRQTYVCPDADTLDALRHQCGVEAGAITQAYAGLWQGRVAVLLVALSPEQIQALFGSTLSRASRGDSRLWYQVRFSIDDITTGRPIRLQNMFETLFLSTREPTGAVMFGNRNVQDDYTYYFSPPCAGFFGVVLSGFGASTCAPPVPKSVILLAGDAGALGAGRRW